MIVTLTTDFGTADYFVGAMKGAILTVDPKAQIVDLTHDVPPHDIYAGAFTLLAAYDTFPPGTVHVAVVDPGVGSSRRGLIATGSRYSFVAPDNGVLGYIYERVENLKVYELTKREFFRDAVSSSFHGRDIFAPVAGALSRGTPADEMGIACTDFQTLTLQPPQSNPDGSVTGTVIHVDRFGNCITNISRRDFSPDLERTVRIMVGNHEIGAVRQFFAEHDTQNEPFAIWGSAGFLEIAINRDSASSCLRIARGEAVVIQAQ